MSVKSLLKESLFSVYQSNLINEVDWEDKFSDTKAKCVTPDSIAQEMNDELARLGVKASKREKRGVGKPIYTKGNIEKTMTDGSIDMEKFKTLITSPPPSIFDQNPKIEKTDKGKAQMTVNTGLPAIVGVIFDEKQQKFYKINTCPGAGSCKLVCYARKGFYGMNDGKILIALQMLNFLLNDPENFYVRLKE